MEREALHGSAAEGVSDGEETAVYKAMRLSRFRVRVREAEEVRWERRGGCGGREVVQEEVQDVAAVVPPVVCNGQVSYLTYRRLRHIEETLTDAAEVGAIEQASIAVVCGLPSPNLVDLVVRLANVLRDEALKPWLPSLST